MKSRFLLYTPVPVITDGHCHVSATTPMKNLSPGLKSAILSLMVLCCCSNFLFGQTLFDSFADGNFSASPVWGGNTTLWTVQANSDVAAGATGSNTVRLNAPAITQTDYLSSQVITWGGSQEWGFWLGRRGQAYTAANQAYIWLYANESTLNNTTVDGYRLAIGDDTGGDELRLEYIVNGALSATVITSTGAILNGLMDIGFVIRVTRSSSGLWTLYTNTLPTTSGTGSIATTIPDASNANNLQGSATHNTIVPSSNGYLGIACLHSTGASAIVAMEFDQAYFTACTPPTSLSYTLDPAIYCANTAIATNSPTFTGSNATSYAVLPALPAGLSLDPISGQITGTPTTAIGAADYIVTVTNGCGNTSEPVNITVLGSTVSTDYFRSAADGNWSDASTWESSVDGINWCTATISPSFDANTITIRNGHEVELTAVTTSADQIVIESGGTLTVATGSELVVKAGPGIDLTNSGTFDVNGHVFVEGLINNNGTTTVDGWLRMMSTGSFAGNIILYGPSSVLEYNDGSHTVNGSIWPPAGPLHLYITTNGTVTIPTVFDRTLAGQLSYTFAGTLSSGSVLTVGAEVVGGITYTGTGKLVMNGINKTIYSGTISNLEIATGASINSASEFGLTVTNDLKLNGSLDMNGYALTVGGNILGTGTQTDGTITMSGSNKSISNVSLDNLSIAGTGTSVSAGPLTIGGELSLTGGNLSLGGYNLYPGTITGPPSRFIVTNGTGQVVMVTGVGIPRTFPVGSSDISYDPVTITVSSPSTFLVNVSQADDAGDFPGTINDFGSVAPRIWNLNPSGNPGATDISLTSGDGMFVPSAPYVLGHYNGMDWEEIPANYTPSTWTADDVTSFSPFGAGEAGGFVLACTSPTVDDDPAPQTSCDGESASFLGTFTGGDPAPSLQWQVQVDGMGAWSNIVEGSPYTGVNTNTLTIDPSTLSLDGNLYRLVATNDCGDVPTSAALLTVTTQLTFYGDLDGDGLGDPAVTTTACAPPAGYVDNDDDFCPLTIATVSNAGNCGCSPGMYPITTVIESQTVITGCQICPTGTYCPDGLAGPIPCPAGQFMDLQGATVCIPCAAGTYNPNTGQISCTECEAGKYSSATGQIACTPCPAGTYNPITGQIICTDCEAGKYSSATGQIACTPCPAGTYNPSTGQISCTDCEAGKYSSTTGQIACTPCPAGTYNPSTGQISCTDCEAGKYNSVTGQIACTPCPAGSYNPSTGQIACTECEAGKYSSSTGQIACTPCPSGTYNPNTGQITCTDCEAGKYNSATGQITCTPCPAGTYNPNTGQIICTDCEAGSYNPNTGQIACTPCPAGEYSGTTGAIACTECAAGTYNSQTGQSSCQPCQAGYYNPDTGQTSCTECAPGSYSSMQGQTACTPCPVNTYNNLPAQIICIDCPSGSYAPEGQTSCTPCALNLDDNPDDITICQTGMTTFTALFSGSGTISYQWQFYDDVLMMWVPVPAEAPYSGEATNALTITNPTLQFDDYQYRVVASNDCGNLPSLSATLNLDQYFGAEILSETPDDVCGLTYVGLEGTDQGFATGTWSHTNGTGTASFSHPNLPITSVTMSGMDTYGTKEFTWTITNGLCTSSDVALITFNELPIANAGNDETVCNGIYTLSAAVSPGTGIWTSNLPVFFFDETDPNTTVLLSSGVGVYTFTWTKTLGSCTASDDVVITYNNMATPECPANFSVCLNGGPVTLTATPAGGIYTGNSGIFNGNMFDPTEAGGPGQKIITYTVNDGTLCEASCTFTITVEALPVVTCPVEFQVCESDASFALSGATPTGGTYSGPGVINGEFNPANAQIGYNTIDYTYTDPMTMCSRLCSFTIEVIENPDAEAGTYGSLCENGDDLILAGSPPNGTWTGIGVSLHEVNGYVFDPSVGSQTLTYTVTTGPGCSYSDMVTINVLDEPEITCQSNFSICPNDPPVMLTSMPTGGVYSGNNGIFNGNMFDPTEAGGPGIYTITYTVTDINMCTSTCTFEITVKPLPTGVSAGGDYEFCGTFGLLDASEVPFGGTGSWSYSTFGTGTLFFNNLNDPNTSVIASEPGDYDLTWTITAANGCSRSAFALATFLPTPDLPTCDFETTVCNTTTPFQLTVIGSGGVFTSDDPGGDAVSPTGLFNPASATQNGPTLITYTVTDMNGCSSSCTGQIYVNTQPAIPECPGNVTIALGDLPLDLTSLEYFPTNGSFSGTGVSGDIFSTAMTGNYTITYTVTNVNCSNSCTFEIQVTEDECLAIIQNTTTLEFYCTIQEAIDDAANGQRIAIPSGSYPGNVDATLKDVVLAPGNSPGCVNIVGNMTLTSGDDLEIEIAGSTACTGYDQFDIDGTVTLGNADLDIVLTYTPSNNSTYTIIDNDGADAVSGQFAQGTAFSADGYNFTVNYAGGDGNDVVLSVCAAARNTTTLETYCALQAAVSDASPGQTVELLQNVTEGVINVNQGITIDGQGFTLTSTSPSYGINVFASGVTIIDLTLQDAGTFGIQVDCGSHNLVLTNVTVDDCGGTGISINGSDNCILTNITSTNNTGNGLNVTNSDNTTINGITTFGNAFMTGFTAGIGIFTSNTYCLPAGVNGLNLTGTVNIAELPRVYSQKTNAADPIIGLTGDMIEWAAGVGALDRSYWDTKAEAYATVDALFEPPYNFPNTIVYVAEVATENFYVDDDPNGDASPPMLIQTAITFEVPGKIIFVEAGNYNEDVLINKTLTLQGSGIGNSVVSGPIGGAVATFQASAAGVIIDGFTITRDGNNVAQWNGALNTVGVAVQGLTVSAEIRNNHFIGNRSGIDINNSVGNNIHNNIIEGNHTGVIFRNQTDNTLLNENFIQDNRTVGVLFLDASGGTNSPVQSALNSSFNDNFISGNWYAEIVDRQAGGSLPAPGTNPKNFECNWYGTTTPVITTSNSAEPGYAVLIPVIYGGTATPPMGSPDIAGPASANFDYILYLVDGTDDLPLVGFQPVAGSCSGGPVRNTTQNISYATLQSAINAAAPGDNIELLTNITEGIVSVNKSLSIDGQGFTLTSTSASYGINVFAAGVTIIDLTLQDAGTFGIQVDCGSHNLVLTNVTVDDCGGTGISINGSDNAVLTNITSTNNTGNGLNVTNSDNTTINGITTFGNAFMTGFTAGIGIFTSNTYCLPAGVNGLNLTGTVNIAELPRVYSQKTNAADPIIGLSGDMIEWAAGVGALDRTYWDTKAEAYAAVDALFEPPYNFPNTIVYVAEVATENFYVDDDPNGDASPPMLIQAAINFEVPGKTIFVENGNYNEDVAINKTLTLQGSGIGNSVASGPIGGSGATFQVQAAGVVIDGFTITRDGNNLAQWNDPGLNTAGIAVQGLTVNAEIRNNRLMGNRTGIDINNSSGNNIHNNLIEGNHTGLIFRNETNNTSLKENFIQDNRTVGVLFLDASGGTNIPVQSALNSTFNENYISGNWYAEIVDRQAGGSLPLPGSNPKNFECNWYGTTTPVITTSNSAEPGYASLIPVIYGGTATPPVGSPDIAGPASANFDYIPFLVNGTDADMEIGFQPVAMACTGGLCDESNAPEFQLEVNGTPLNNGETTTHCHGDLVSLEITGDPDDTYVLEFEDNVIASGNVGDPIVSFNAVFAGEGEYTITVTDDFGCTSSATYTVDVNLCQDPSSFEWVLLPTDEEDACLRGTDCCEDVLCYGLKYTPGLDGNLTNYTTGFITDCIGMPANNPIPISMNGDSNYSCIMQDASFEFEDCGVSGTILFNSSGLNGNYPVMAGVADTIHKVCFLVPVGESLVVIEDEPTDLSTSIEIEPGVFITEFPSYTDLLVTRTGLTVPMNGSSTEECFDFATPPTPPVVYDMCGNEVVPDMDVDDMVDMNGCEGERVYTFTYEDCSGFTAVWIYTYEIERTVDPREVGGPVATSANVVGIENAIPPSLPMVVDTCGTELTDPLVTIVDMPDPIVCGGIRTYTYVWSDCAGLTYTWTFTYNINNIPVLDCPDDMTLCLNVPAFALTGALPAGPGGVYSGPGVNSMTGFFDPFAAGVGTHLITYTYTNGEGCSEDCTFNITVNPIPMISCRPNAAVCIFEDAFVITGNAPPGGVYTGAGIVGGNMFDPEVAGLGSHLITYTVTGGNGCTNSCSFTFTVTNCPGDPEIEIIPTDPCNPANSGACVDSTECCNDQICFVIRYTPGYSGSLLNYTTGFVTNCIPGFDIPVNASCVMNDNSYEAYDCDVSQTAYFNSSGNEGNLPIQAGVPVVLHQVCFTLLPGQSAQIVEDLITDLSSSIALTSGPVVTEFPSYGPPVTITVPAVVIPMNGSENVECEEDIVMLPPPPPNVNGPCCMVMAPMFVSDITTPDLMTCTGTRVITYKYNDCRGDSYFWTYTYYIQHMNIGTTGEIGGPVPNSSTVNCYLQAVEPVNLPNVVDGCGNPLPAPEPIVGGTNTGGCSGTVTYTYIYLDCENQSFTWTYTYTVSCQSVQVQVFLQGPYNTASNEMTTTLNFHHLLPGQDKLLSPDITVKTQAPFTPFGHPYTGLPWTSMNPAGQAINSGLIYGDPSSPGAPMGTITYPSTVVDWVLVTIRQGGLLPANNIWSCAGWLHKDGTVTFPDNCGEPSIDVSMDQYILVQHRNHLAVLSPSPVDNICGSAIVKWDFRIADSYKPGIVVYGQHQVETGVWAMHHANGAQVTTPVSIGNINSEEESLWQTFQNSIGYRLADFDMNAAVNNNDYTIWTHHQGKFTGIFFY